MKKIFMVIIIVAVIFGFYSRNQVDMNDSIDTIVETIETENIIVETIETENIIVETILVE